MNRPTSVAPPTECFAVVVVLPDVEGVLCWGPNEREVDVVAVADGRALVWPSAQECLDDVRSWGWNTTEQEPAVFDLRPLAGWLRGRRFALDPVAALNVWNLAGDVAAALGLPWSDRGRVADACFDKLTIANVPWLAGRDAYRPRWSTREHTYLRRVLSEAVALIRAQLIAATA